MMKRFLVLLSAIAALPLLTAAEKPRAASEVVPLTAAHSHNDYAHARPLFDALDHGFCSVEADIFLVDGKLEVGHLKWFLRSDRTLESLYLEPLRQRIKQNGGRVYRNGPTVTLLIEIKTEPGITYAELRKTFAKYADILTSVENGKVNQRAVTAIITGNLPRRQLAADPVRYAMLDGQPKDLDSKASPDLIPWVSVSWSGTFAWRGEGPMPAAERKKLQETAVKAHQSGRKLRFWGAPDALAVWKELRAAGVDLLSVDDLVGAQKFLLEDGKH